METKTVCKTPDPWVSFPRVLNVGHGRHEDPTQYVRKGVWTGRNHYCVLQLTLAGQGIVEDSHGIHRVMPGQAFLLRMPDRLISWQGDADSGQGWEFLWISFTGGGCEAIVDELIVRKGRVQAIDVQLPVVARWRSYIQPKEPCTEQALPLAQLIWSLLGEYASGPSDIPVHQQGAKLANQALDQIIRCDVIPRDVKSLAASLHISREHLSRMMVNHLGKSPQEVLQEERLRRAQAMLRSTALPNRTIAQAIGLSTWQLVRLLRSATGLTPAEYRASTLVPENNSQVWGESPNPVRT